MAPAQHGRTGGSSSAELGVLCDVLDCRRHGVKTIKWGNALLQMSNVKVVLLPKIGPSVFKK